jgi:hypothetical protein
LQLFKSCSYGLAVLQDKIASRLLVTQKPIFRCLLKYLAIGIPLRKDLGHDISANVHLLMLRRHRSLKPKQRPFARAARKSQMLTVSSAVQYGPWWSLTVSEMRHCIRRYESAFFLCEIPNPSGCRLGSVAEIGRQSCLGMSPVPCCTISHKSRQVPNTTEPPQDK